MNRSFAVAVLTIALVALVAPSHPLLAQAGKPTDHVPTDLTGPAGASIEIYMNSGKVADLTLTQQGTGSLYLDFSNMGKVQVQIYVDVCQDGKMMKVLVVAGQQPPEDQNCKRRVLGVPWNVVCGVTHITLDLTKFLSHITGCGSFISSPKGYTTVGGLLIGGLLVTKGGGNDKPVATTVGTSVPTATTQQTPVQQNPVVPPANNTPVVPPNTNTPAPPQTPAAPTTPANSTITQVAECVTHFSGFSVITLTFFAFPPIEIDFIVATNGPGVRQPMVQGRTRASDGLGRITIDITQFGFYSSLISFVQNGTTVTGNGSINVGSPGTC